MYRMSDYIKIRLDDERPVPDKTWKHAKTFNSFFTLVYQYKDFLWEVSFDHDLWQSMYDGYDVLVWFCKTCRILSLRPKISIHSANCVWVERMEAQLEEYKQY